MISEIELPLASSGSCARRSAGDGQCENYVESVRLFRKGKIFVNK